MFNDTKRKLGECKNILQKLIAAERAMQTSIDALQQYSEEVRAQKTEQISTEFTNHTNDASVRFAEASKAANKAFEAETSGRVAPEVSSAMQYLSVMKKGYKADRLQQICAPLVYAGRVSDVSLIVGMAKQLNAKEADMLSSLSKCTQIERDQRDIMRRIGLLSVNTVQNIDRLGKIFSPAHLLYNATRGTQNNFTAEQICSGTVEFIDGILSDMDEVQTYINDLKE